jgi:hypothetical protein
VAIRERGEQGAELLQRTGRVPQPAQPQIIDDELLWRERDRHGDY